MKMSTSSFKVRKVSWSILLWGNFFTEGLKFNQHVDSNNACKQKGGNDGNVSLITLHPQANL